MLIRKITELRELLSHQKNSFLRMFVLVVDFKETEQSLDIF